MGVLNEKKCNIPYTSLSTVYYFGHGCGCVYEFGRVDLKYQLYTCYDASYANPSGSLFVLLCLDAAFMYFSVAFSATSGLREHGWFIM